MSRSAPRCNPQIENAALAARTALSRVFVSAPQPAFADGSRMVKSPPQVHPIDNFTSIQIHHDSIATPLRGVPSDVAMANWDDLFGAVTARLRSTVDEHLLSTSERQVAGATKRIQTCVLECAAALDQLQEIHSRDFDRRRHIEIDLFDAQTALAQARSELAGTQAGERHARYLAAHDSLTSLPNRSHFLERLEEALANSRSHQSAVALLYLDLDNFKSVNDLYGHGTGDALLRIVAARLTRAVRMGDVVSRLGGDEFACLFADLPDPVQLSELSSKLLAAVVAPLKIGELTLCVRPSIGIAMWPADGASAVALLKSADTAMYRAKRDQTGYAFATNMPKPARPRSVEQSGLEASHWK